MNIQQLYTNCLAQGTYYIESDGVAAIIDPLREVQQYIDLAESRGAKIKYVFETHFHADFVSGHIDLARKTGANIVYGPTNMTTGFKAIIGFDGQLFPLGKAVIRLIHTPGHTMESSCFLLINEAGKETALFTGDTLFIGDVGRPDLAQHVIAELTQEKLAGYLYDSLRQKIMPLNDELIVYPAHGAGSACGKNMSKETFDTLGNQKRTNYALHPQLSKEAFIEQLLDGLVTPPHYFPSNVLMNVIGYESVDAVIAKGTTPVSPQKFRDSMKNEQVFILDTRKAETFGDGFVPNAVNIGLNGDLAVWAGTLIPSIQDPVLLVVDPGTEKEVVTRLARVGCDNVIGYLDGGFASWKAEGYPVDVITTLSPEEFLGTYRPGVLLDVRKASEFNAQHFLGAVNKPLDFIEQNAQTLDPDDCYYIHCAGGYRSMIYASILRKKGFSSVTNLAGGFNALNALNKLPITEFVCQSSML